MADKFDRYSVSPVDEMLALGGRPSASRFSAEGFEDCAREWDPCQCHGDRRCRIGQLHRFGRTVVNDIAWMRGKMEDKDPETIMRIAGCRYPWELQHRISGSEKILAEWARDLWPMYLANAAQERQRMVAADPVLQLPDGAVLFAGTVGQFLDQMGA